MWPEMYEFSTLMLSVILTAAATKLVDDYLDQDIDRHAGRKNWCTSLGAASIVYACLLLCIAASLNTTISMALFFSSYIVGMFSHWDSIFFSRLKGWQEILIVLVLGIFLFNWRTMFFCLFFIFAVQLIDDFIDARDDIRAGYHNLAHRIGRLECLLLAAIALMLAWILGDRLFPPVTIGTVIFYLVILKWQEAQTC